MICKKCIEGADVKNHFGAFIQKKKLHSQCKGGTWCDCQHRIGRKNVQ